MWCVRSENNSWGIRWYLSVFMQKGLVLYPSHTLVENLGMDGTGVHCGKGSFLDGEAIIDGFSPKMFPNTIEINTSSFNTIKNKYFRESKVSFFKKIGQKFKWILPS